MINILTNNESTKQLNKAVLECVKHILVDDKSSVGSMCVVVSPSGDVEARLPNDTLGCLKLATYQQSKGKEGVTPRYTIVVDDSLRKKFARALSSAVEQVSQNILKGNY